MNQQLVHLSKKILFVEFLVRANRFYGKGSVRTTLPHDAFFYTGLSKADGLFVPHIAYDNGKPYVLSEIPQDLYAKIFKDNTNIVCSVTEEYLDKSNIWHKGQADLSSNKTGINGNQGQLPYANFRSIAPYGFNIIDIDDAGTIQTDFPRDGIVLEIGVGQTLCFLCRREERGDGEWYIPNLNLVLFVKNHGLHDTLEVKSQRDINRMAEWQLCNEKFSLRDFRKSSLNFELG